MSFTGYDSVFVSPGQAGAPITQFLDTLSSRWPHLLVSVEGWTGDEFTRWRSRGHLNLPAEKGVVLVARDREMVESWDDTGYDPSPDGEGPCSIWYQRSPCRSVRISLIDDPYDRGEFAFEPYEADLVGSHLSLVTVVTPDRDSPFSTTLIDSMAAALSTDPPSRTTAETSRTSIAPTDPE